MSILINSYAFGGGGGGSAPLPNTLANLAIWNQYNTGLFEDAAMTIPATGTDPVGAWQDQSGNNNHMIQATAGDRPVLNSGAVDFVSGDKLVTTSAVTLKPMTFFCLIKFDSLATGIRIFDGPGAISVDTDTTSLRLLKSGVAMIGTSTAVLATGAYTRIIVTYDGSGNYAFYVNGSAEGTGTNNQAIPSVQYDLGGNTGLLLDGQIKDWGVYTDAKTGADITTINTYLASL